MKFLGDERIFSVLFLAGKPVPSQRLAEICGLELNELLAQLATLEKFIANANLGIFLQSVSGGWILATKPEHSELLEEFAVKKVKRLTKAAAETLAIVAYKQPVSKTEIESIRGVDAAPTLKTLLEQELICQVGRDNTLGHSLLFSTTDNFLVRFGIKSLSELPTPREISEVGLDYSPVQE